MTEQIQVLNRRLEGISKHLIVIWIEGNRRWVPLLGGVCAFRVTWYEREGLVDKEETPALYDCL